MANGEEVRVEPSELEVKASEVNAPWPQAPANPIPPCGLLLAGLAVQQLNASASTIALYAKSGEAEATRLSQSLLAAANAYRAVDDAARTALDRGTEPSIPPVPVSPNLAPPVPIPADLPAFPSSPDPAFLDVLEAARQIEQPDQANSLDEFERAWNSYAAQLDERAESFHLDDVNWDSPAASAAAEAMQEHAGWLRGLAESSKKLASQAGELATAHRKAKADHPTYEEVKAAADRIQHAMDAAEGISATHAYAALQAESERVLGEYAVGAYSPRVRPEAPPNGAPNMDPVSGNGDPRKPGDNKPGGPGSEKPGGQPPAGPPVGDPAAMAQGMQPPPTQPRSGAPASGGAPSGSGAPSGGGAPAGGGAPSGGGKPGGLPGGLPGGEPEMPGLPTDPSLRPAAASGGGAGGGAGGGGGMPSTPMSPSVGGVAVGPSPSAGAGPGGTGAAPAGPAGAAGAMGGGMGPMMGQRGGAEGKEKRRDPKLAPDEDLYTEDRPWTEAIIGQRRRRDAQEGKDSK